MGLNFSAACHVHRECMTISRGDEHQGLHSFWSAHEHCARANPAALECAGDGYTERDWMDAASGYRQFFFTAERPRWAGEEYAGRSEPWKMGWRTEDSTSSVA